MLATLAELRGRLLQITGKVRNSVSCTHPLYSMSKTVDCRDFEENVCCIYCVLELLVVAVAEYACSMYALS